MAYEEMSLDQLGQHANAYYKRGEVANKKAGDHATSCGLLLAEAKRRLDEEYPYGQRTQAFEVFLSDHCPDINAKGRSRAYQLIAHATGKRPEEETKAANAEANRAYRERKRLASCPSRDGKVQQTALPKIIPHQPTLATARAAAMTLKAMIEGIPSSELRGAFRFDANAALDALIRALDGQAPVEADNDDIGIPAFLKADQRPSRNATTSS